jgi:hypothetical protein
MTPSTVTLRIILEAPPSGIDFALQEGHGNNYEVTQRQKSKGKDLKFEFTVTAKPGKAQPNFTGPFAQGPAGDRFVYINIGTYAGQTDTWCGRRLKIPLSLITWDMLKSGNVLVAHVPGTAADGTPTCASSWRKSLPSWSWTID